MLNKAFIRDKWIPALRSEQYSQGKNYLRYRHETMPDQFCCLGVACDIIARDQLIPGAQWSDDGHGASTFQIVQDGRVVQRDSEDLPLAVQEFIGISSSGTVRNLFVPLGGWDDEEDDERPVNSLITLNDDENFDFEQIADIIETVLAEDNDLFFAVPGDVGSAL